MDAEYKKSLGELTNLTRTTMKQSQIDLINMLDEADLRVAAGTQSYSAAVCNILDRYAGRGIHVDYPSGTRRTLEAAVRCCVVTSMNQTAAQVTNQYIVEAGAEYVLVSAHLGARVVQKGQPALADHSAWQGKVYRIRGTEPGYPNLLDRTGYDVDPNTGQGTVKNPLGLHGYNCRHSHKPWDKRLRNPYVDENGNLKIDSEENRKRYELQQKQRYMERSIRATKRKLIEKEEQINNSREDMDVDKLQKEYDQIAFRMTQQNKEYNDFCKANDLQPQYDRVKVADFGREQTKRSNAGAKRYTNNKPDSVEKSADFDIMQMKGKLSDVEARKWYIEQNNKIPTLIDRTKTLEEQARQACDMRNNNRTIARDLMKDQNKRKALDISDPTIPFEELVQKKMSAKGISYEEAIADIVQTATKTRRSVNKALGLED